MSNAITKDAVATEGCAAVAGYVGRAPVNLADLKTCLERVQLEVRTCQDMSNLLDLPLVMQIGMSVEASLQAMITIVRATPHTTSIRRRRAQDHEDTTDSLRAVACMRWFSDERPQSVVQV